MQPFPRSPLPTDSLRQGTGQLTTRQPISSLELLASHIERALPLVVLLVAIFLRAYSLDTIPRGLLPDEAFNGIDASKILDGERPIFLAENNGREALFVYLQAISVALLGQTTLALRIVSAACGILTVLAGFILVRQMFSTRVALLASAWMALSLWHVIFSRMGLRTISLPLFLAVGFYCLWRGLEGVGAQEGAGRASPTMSASSAVWFALGGIAIGLSLYTYSTARFAPFIILAWTLYIAVLHRHVFQRALPGLILALALTAALFLPQGIFFLNHPESFVERAREVTIVNPTLRGEDPGQALLESALRSLGMFAIQGDAAAARNIPGRPFFDPFSALLMIMGLGLALRRFRQPAYGLLIIWLVVMFLPILLAIEGAPNYLRVTGMAPALFVLPAIAAASLWEAWEPRIPAVLRTLPVVIVTLAFLGGTVHTYHSYFELWANRSDVWRNFHWGSYVILDAALKFVETERKTILLASNGFDEAWLEFALSRQSGNQNVRLFDPRRSFIFPTDDSNAGYIFPYGLPRLPSADRYFDESLAQVVGTLPSGRPITLHRLINPQPPFEPEHAIPARFGDRVFVYGFDVPKVVRAGGIMIVQWYWRLLATDERELAFTNQLFGEDNRRRGQVDDVGFSPLYWPAGTSGITTFEIDIDPAAPTGAYWLHVAMYERGSQDFSNLPVFDEQGNRAGNHLRLGPIKVHGRPPASSSEGLLPSPMIPDNLLPTTFADQIGLLGYNLSDHTLVPGQSLDLTLFWSPRGRPSQDYTVFVHLLDSQGQLRGQADSPPTSGKYPTPVWDAGEFIADSHTLSLPNDLPGGEYKLAIGLYDPETGRRLQTVDGSGNTTGDSVTISGLMVQPE